MATVQVNLYEAKTQLSSLVERAAKGEEIIIAKAGTPMARLTALAELETGPQRDGPKIYREFGKNLLGIAYMADDWEDDIPLEYFQDEGEENPFGEPSELELGGCTPDCVNDLSDSDTQSGGRSYEAGWEAGRAVDR